MFGHELRCAGCNQYFPDRCTCDAVFESVRKDLLVNEILHLHLCFEYFDAIVDGSKDKEYRDAEKWKERLDKNNYKIIRLYRGYEKLSDDTVLNLPYKGYELEKVTHLHFNNEPKIVCAIDVSH